jgi:nicotinamidase/pyrazinamidase
MTRGERVATHGHHPMRLLIIDPQNDFMDQSGAALAVPGALADMQRLAGLIDTLSAQIDAITVTLDSHAGYGIERTTFWLDADGAPVPPFTAVTAADVNAGRFQPRDPVRKAEALAYLRALEAGGERTLVVWPVHCVLGSWGHNIEAGLAQSIARWEQTRARACDKVVKGLNPMTEQYSAFRADVPRADDPRTQLNTALLERLGAGDDLLLVAGEAASHCVAASGQDMLAQWDAARLRNTVFLTDCMSPVPGFEAAAEAFVQQLQGAGVRCRHADALIAEARR